MTLKENLAKIEAYEKCILNRKNQIVHFPIIVSDNQIDMSRIYPTKQRNIKNVLSALRTDDRINRLTLFGSSITMACNKDSDIDLAVDLKEYSTTVRNDISEKIQLACNWNADIIWMDHLSSDDRIYKDIMKGLVLI